MNQEFSHNPCTSTCAMTRRQAFRVAVKGGVVFVLTLLIDSEAAAAPAWVKVGPVSRFPVGVPTKVALRPGQSAFVLRQQNNHWLAVSTRCTHQGGEVRWDPAKKKLVCPLHQATFGVDGKSPTGPARAPLQTYPTQVSAGNVHVDVSSAPAPNARSRGSKGDHGHERKEHEEHERKHHGKDDKHHRNDDKHDRKDD